MKTQLKIIYGLIGVGMILPIILIQAKETSTKLLLMWITIAILVAIIVVASTDPEYRARLKRYFWVPIGAGLLLYGFGRFLMN